MNRRWFSAINATLKATGLPEHHEPEELGGETPWSIQMYSYRGLHYLRRVAAHVEAGLGVPEPGGEAAENDEILRRRYRSAMGPRKTSFWKPNPPQPHRRSVFHHLIDHSDAEGFYLPMDFEDVLLCNDSEVPGGLVGSTVALKEECELLAGLLELPLTLDPESDEVWLAPDSQGTGAEKWQRYGIESFTCLGLHRACEASLRLGAAIAFV